MQKKLIDLIVRVGNLFKKNIVMLQIFYIKEWLHYIFVKA